MRCAFVAAVLVIVFATGGCQQNALPSPALAITAAPRPASPPALDPGLALRPTFAYGTKQSEAGTAFVVQDKAGEQYLLTAAHLLDPPEWAALRTVTVGTLQQKPATAGQAQGPALYVGTSFQELPSIGGLLNITKNQDLIIPKLNKHNQIRPLRLAATDPGKGVWAWVLGQEVGQSTAQKAFLCQCSSAAQGGIQMNMQDRFKIQAFSGGPVVNQPGEVVGNFLGGDPDRGYFVGVGVSSIRKRFQQLGITLD